MKLKKIVSLALAGVLAVSMLAGCKGGESSSSSDSTVVTPVTGVAASINAELDDNKELISFADSSAMQGLLDTYFQNNKVAPSDADNASTVVAYANSGLAGTLATYIKDALKLDDNHVFSDDTFSVTNNSGKDLSGVNVYVLNSEKLTEAGALKLVGQYLDSLNLPEDDGNTNAKYYEYEGSVAMVNAKTKGETKSVWVIAVAIDRTAEDR